MKKKTLEALVVVSELFERLVKGKGRSINYTEKRSNQFLSVSNNMVIAEVIGSNGSLYHIVIEDKSCPNKDKCASYIKSDMCDGTHIKSYGLNPIIDCKYYKK